MGLTGHDVAAMVPRHLFIPERVWVRRPNGYLVPFDRAGDPAGWRDLCDDPDEAIVTHVDDTCVWPTSSSSTPAVMARMLNALDLRPGMRVLEIGTGTGYNAAVLAELTGSAANVTTIDIDADVTAHASRALTAGGYGDVRVITGDGAHGVAEHAPYDRIVATAAVARVPYPWVAQTRPRGLIVAPYTGVFPPDGAMLTLTATGERLAYGRFDGEAHFMPLRTPDRPPASDVGDLDEYPRHRLGITVTRDHEHVWVDTPDALSQST